MTSLYKILKSAKLGAGAAQDFHTAIMAQKMPFAKGSGAEHEYTGAVPVTFTANGQPLLDYLISGNTVQSATPTPDSPIMPQGTGERTGNLFDYSTITTGYRIVWATGALYADTTGIISDFIEVTEGLRYQISDSTKSLTAFVIGYDQNKEYLGVYNSVNGFIKASSNRYNTLIIPQDSGCKYVKLMTFTENPIDNTSMFTAGATVPSEFIPYGFKIPISSANTTTPVYLGEVQSTRQIKKKVFDGSENWRLSGGNLYSDAVDADALGSQVCRCTHFTSSGSAGIYVSVGANRLKLFSAAFPEGVTNATTMQTWVTQQYNNGTPLVVWYVLATEETGIVNKPLRKIGDYADTLSKAQAGVEIPTARGTNTLDVLTDVKPSEVYIKYKE